MRLLFKTLIITVVVAAALAPFPQIASSTDAERPGDPSYASDNEGMNPGGESQVIDQDAGELREQELYTESSGTEGYTYEDQGTDYEQSPSAVDNDPIDMVNMVESIGFEVMEGVGIITITTTAPVGYSELPHEMKKMGLKMEQVFLPAEFRVSRDVGDFDSPVSFISSFGDPVAEDEVLVIINFKEEVVYEVIQDQNHIMVKVGEPKKTEEELAEEEIYEQLEEEELWAFDFRAATELGQRKQYKGQLVSFDFKKAQVRDVLRILADISGFNFVIARGVKGTVTLKLLNVPWDLALDIVLEDAGLGAIVEGNVIKVAPHKTLRARQSQLKQTIESRENTEPLFTKQLFVNYANASEIKSLIAPILSERGEIKIDTRTNSLLITDTQSRLVQAQDILRKLDTRTSQVLIEARIVQATLDFTRELGVQWGTNFRASPATGNPTNAFFPSSVQVGGVGVGNPGPFGSIGDSFIIDLPAAVGTGAGGALGIVLGSLTGAFDLDIRLSALETRGDGRVLSSPKILTLDNHLARIEQGVSIPFLSVSAAGTQTQFVDATLRLEVTPHVTNDDRISMKIRITDNAPDPSITGANGTPAIRRNEAETQVLARDGETIVIGGIFSRTTAESMRGVPWFSKLPLLGFLFSNTSRVDTRRELLVFITPRIIR